jgi:hypothetical protein
VKETERTSMVAASLWMIVISLALFFLPLVNGLIGGAIGGYKAGDWKRALAAAILPAVVVAAGLWVLLALLNAPFWGLIAGTALGAVIVLADVGLLIGAVVGGAIRQNDLEHLAQT